MGSRIIRVPASIYKESMEYRNMLLKRDGFNIPIWKAVVEVERERKRRGGFVL